MQFNGFNVTFKVNGIAEDVSDVLPDYLRETHDEDPELHLWAALSALAENLRDGGADVDYTWRATHDDSGQGN